MVINRVTPKKKTRQGVLPRTDAAAIEAMNNRKVVRSSTEEDMLPEQMMTMLNNLRRGMSAKDWEFLRKQIMPRYEAAVANHKKDVDAANTEAQRIKEELAAIFSKHLKSFKNLILDEVE